MIRGRLLPGCHRSRWLLALGFAALLLCYGVWPQPERWRGLAFFAPASLPRQLTSTRIIVIGDVHGAADAFAAILTQAGLIDASRAWAGGGAIFVLTGDFTDRGAQVRDVMDLLMALEPQAGRAGGRMHVLMGNHEAMNLLSEFRDVTPAIFATFADGQSEKRREDAYGQYADLLRQRAAPKDAWMAAHPPGFFEYVEAMAPNGTYGKWLRGRAAVAQIGELVMLHGGLDPGARLRSVDAVNKQVQRDLKAFDQARETLVRRRLALPFFTLHELVEVARLEAERINSARVVPSDAARIDDPAADPALIQAIQTVLQIGASSLLSPTGPLWFRGFATWNDEGRAQVDALQRIFSGTTRFIVGHTIPATMRVTPRFGGRVVLIDTGMLATHFKGGRASALEISGTRATAIYLDGTQSLTN